MGLGLPPGLRVRGAEVRGAEGLLAHGLCPACPMCGGGRARPSVGSAGADDSGAVAGGGTLRDGRALGRPFRPLPSRPARRVPRGCSEVGSLPRHSTQIVRHVSCLVRGRDGKRPRRHQGSSGRSILWGERVGGRRRGVWGREVGLVGSQPPSSRDPRPRPGPGQAVASPLQDGSRAGGQSKGPSWPSAGLGPPLPEAPCSPPLAPWVSVHLGWSGRCVKLQLLFVSPRWALGGAGRRSTECEVSQVHILGVGGLPSWLPAWRGPWGQDATRQAPNWVSVPPLSFLLCW